MWERFVTRVKTYAEVVKELQNTNVCPLYIINNMAHFHSSGSLSIVLPYLNDNERGVVIPPGWLPYDITLQIDRQTLATQTKFLEMVAAGNILVLSTWRATRLLRSEEGRIELQRLIDRDMFIREQATLRQGSDSYSDWDY